MTCAVHVMFTPTHVLAKMGKSIRSKRRQRVLAVRRQKYRDIERQKCWEHHLSRQAERAIEMAEPEGGEQCFNSNLEKTSYDMRLNSDVLYLYRVL